MAEEYVYDDGQENLDLPITRVKRIMQVEGECMTVSPEATFLVSRAAGMFLELLAARSGTAMAPGGSELTYKDVAKAVSDWPAAKEFLSDIVPTLVRAGELRADPRYQPGAPRQPFLVIKQQPKDEPEQVPTGPAEPPPARQPRAPPQRRQQQQQQQQPSMAAAAPTAAAAAPQVAQQQQAAQAQVQQQLQQQQQQQQQAALLQQQLQAQLQAQAQAAVAAQVQAQAQAAAALPAAQQQQLQQYQQQLMQQYQQQMFFNQQLLLQQQQQQLLMQQHQQQAGAAGAQQAAMLAAAAAMFPGVQLPGFNQQAGLALGLGQAQGMQAGLAGLAGGGSGSGADKMAAGMVPLGTSGTS